MARDSVAFAVVIAIAVIAVVVLVPDVGRSVSSTAGSGWVLVPGYDGPPVRWDAGSGVGVSWTPVFVAFEVPRSGFSAALDEIVEDGSAVVYRFTVTGPDRPAGPEDEPGVVYVCVPITEVLTRSDQPATVEVRVQGADPGAPRAPYVRALEFRAGSRFSNTPR